MKKSSSLILVALLSAHSLSAELLFHEAFDYPDGILGEQNEWQRDFNNDAPSLAPVRTANVHRASPFPAVGAALHPTNTKETAYRKLPEEITDQTVYFSFNLRSFRTSGSSQFRFRSEDGTVVAVGLVEGRLRASTDNEFSEGLEMMEKIDYFIVGKFTNSNNGREVRVQATAFPEGSSPVEEEIGDWDVTAERTLGMSKVWDGVNIVVGSSSAVFDDIRVGTSWESVTRP